MILKYLNGNQNNFEKKLLLILNRRKFIQSKADIVKKIIKGVKKNGDKALIQYEKKFSNNKINETSIKFSKKEINKIEKGINLKLKRSIDIAYDRIKKFHEKQKILPFKFKDKYKNELSYIYSSIDRVGVYVPGGTASYPSTVLMNCIPAKVAGVKNIFLTTPALGRKVNPAIIYAAKKCGVKEIYKTGGAHSIAAFAYGTKTFKKVDKIVGPGNAYVAEAKRLVFGTVGIDMIAGPSEITIICDGKTNPDWVAMDLFSQAEHDELSQSILISIDNQFLKNVQESINRLIKDMPRKKIITTSLENRGLFILAKDLSEAAKISNFIAPEHLELSVENPNLLLEEISHAGAIFMGKNTCEAVGDYCAGPNHVLPTSGTARFSSPLGVYDFQKRSSLINLSAKTAHSLGDVASNLAMGEGLFAHAESAKYRIIKKNE